LSVHLLFPALSRDGAFSQRLCFSADGAAMSTFAKGGLLAQGVEKAKQAKRQAGNA